jgi:hypothetical protein
MECENCTQENRIAALEKDSERNQNTHREFYGKFERLSSSDAVRGEQYTTIIEKLTRLESKIDEQEKKPARRWDGLVDKILLILAGAFVAWLASGLPGVK